MSPESSHVARVHLSPVGEGEGVTRQGMWKIGNMLSAVGGATGRGVTVLWAASLEGVWFSVPLRRGVTSVYWESYPSKDLRPSEEGKGS